MKYYFSFILPLFFALLATLPVSAMDYSSKIMKELEAHIEIVYQDATKDDNTFPIIGEASKHILITLASWPENIPVPQKLIKAAGAAIGQFCYFSAYTVHLVEHIVLPYLKDGRLTYEDLKTPHCTYTFGLRYSRTSMDPNIAIRMRNGQTISSRYHLNYSVIFNRLLGAFDGSFLLIGGGEKCECENTSRHPKENFYRVDIDNSHLPDMVINAVYLPHLYTFPQEKFDFIWFEHCSVPEMIADFRVFEQYFRFTKPGALILYQTNFKLPGPAFDEIFEESIRQVVKVFEAYQFAVLENENYSTTRKGESKNYKQIIAMKPFLAKDAQEQFSARGPELKINFRALLKPNPKDQAFGLLRAKIFSGQLQIILAFPLEKILSWLPEKHFLISAIRAG